MRDLPIIFTGTNPRAIIEGRKTVTRRIIKPQRIYTGEILAPEQVAREHCAMTCAIRYPYGKTGDMLWVREGFRVWQGPAIDGEPLDPGIVKGPLRDLDQEWLRSRPIEYRADTLDAGPWRSPRFMPRWASRIALRNLSVTADRLQDITEEEAIAEGVDLSGPVGNIAAMQRMGPARYSFATEWERLHGEGAWERNELVWRIEFRREAP